MVRKADLQKKKNDDEIEEYWVQCDACESWIHQICGLFNKGKNDQSVHYLCPSCLILVGGWRLMHANFAGSCAAHVSCTAFVETVHTAPRTHARTHTCRTYAGAACSIAQAGARSSL